MIKLVVGSWRMRAQEAMLLGKVIVSLLCLAQTNDCDGNVKEKYRGYRRQVMHDREYRGGLTN